MLEEFYIACALPHSVEADARFHVSVFLAPTVHTSSQTTLAACPLFRNWGEVARTRLAVELIDQSGPIPCEVLLEPVNPALWRTFFPRDTEVISDAVPDWDQRHWRSFAARRVHDIARDLHMSTIYASPTGKPRLGDLPLADAAAKMLGAERPRSDRTGRILEEQRRPMPDEGRLTMRFDEVVEGRRPLEEIERDIAHRQDWLERVALELHRCRRFYERPESRQEYRDRPDPRAKLPPLPRSKSEFHERCALAGDHGELLRRLGLVLDLRVAEPGRLRQSQWLSAQVSVGGGLNACRTTRVHCRVAGDALVASAEAQDRNWADGALRLGDAQRFSVLALDADGSALKMERYLWTLPRLLRAEENGDPADGATPSLRSPGFTVVATQQAIAIRDRLNRQQDLESAFGGGTVSDLHAADVTRGFRVEVWDEHARRWASLHRRLASAQVTGFGSVYSELPEEGFAQGTAAHESPGVSASPIHIHEALFGWEGWSLSAPRPGLTIVHENGEENLYEAPGVGGPAPAGMVHPIRFEHVVAPGTLPRLRYGRTYAFRAWAVDLAGNSRPRPSDSETTPPQGAGSGAAAEPAAPPPPAGEPWLADALRQTVAGTHARLGAAVVAAMEESQAETAATRVLQDPTIGPEVADRLRSMRASRTLEAGEGRSVRLRELVHGAFARAAADAEVSLFPATAALPSAGDFVTALHPFLRWEPVLTPAVVPRKRYTEGESLRVLVIRSGVRQDAGTLALTVTSPSPYAKSANQQVKNAGYGAESERHLAPPKASQMQAELHGKFDLAIGSDSAAHHRKMLGWALRENGTFRDTTRADIDNPPARLAQKGIALVHVGMPTEPLVKNLASLDPGDPLAPGQTVIHDTDNLWLPYLPDPLARGISIAFPDAGQDRALAFPFGSEDFTVRYGGTWPEVQPFRLRLRGGKELDGRVAGRKIDFVLPPGETLQFRLASSLSPDELDLLGVWRNLPASLSGDVDVKRAAADGLLWGLTPYEDVKLVHAVERPLMVPRAVRVVASRPAGATHVNLLGAVELHGPSTDSLAAEGSWEDSVDDLSRDEWHQSPRSELGFQTRIRPYEDLALLSSVDAELVLPQIGKVSVHNARHELHDTRHRVVRYRFRASTRYREYFAPALLKPDPDNPRDDGVSVIGPEIEVRVPSSARPAAPIVHSVIPLFRWSRTREPDQPMARRHARRSGVRIYLERPWFSSGNDELLGILLAPGGDDEFGPPPEDQSGFAFVSKWGGDPLWKAPDVANRGMPSLVLSNLLHAGGFDDRDVVARPVTGAQTLPLAALEGRPMVTVLGYRPKYSTSRKLWYVDVAIDPGNTFWPFVRMAVCRYQPDSIADHHLSAPMQCDFVQLPPERTTSVSRTDDRHIRVVVSGPVGHRAASGWPIDSVMTLAQAAEKNRRLIALLQKRDPEIASDLGWETMATTTLTLRGQGVSAQQADWVGEIESPVPIALTRPEGTPGQWRVLVEESERLETDPMLGRDQPEGAWEGRLVFADSFEL